MVDNLTKLRNIQLEMLEAFMKVCEAHDLKWYVIFGTLLGVVREEGYLTHDDDIDVAMPAEDYRMLCLHAEWFDDRFFLQTPLDNGTCRHAKLCRNGTTAFRMNLIETLKAGGHLGISIDIFPLEEIPGAGCYHTPSLASQEKLEAVFLKSWFEPAKTGRFEHLTVRMPGTPRKILTEVYEDWNWPTGAEQPGGSLWFFDTEKGYEEYVRRYTGMLDGIEGKKVLLFGAADSLRIWLERFGLKKQVVCTFDNNSGLWGKKSFDVDVRDPKELPGLIDDNTRVIICSLWHQEIGRQLEQMGVTDYYVYLDEYYAEHVGNKVVRREDMEDGKKLIPRWEA